MIEELSKMENKKFIFKCLDLLRDAQLLDNKNIILLTNQELCKNYFYCKFSVLAEVPLYGEVPKEYYQDNTGHRRYYPEKYVIENKAFVVSNHWYGPNKSQADNRSTFLQWVIKELHI